MMLTNDDRERIVEHMQKRIVRHKQHKFRLNLLTLWNEHRITQEEYEGIERLLGSNNLEDLEVARVIMKTLRIGRARLRIKRHTKQMIYKMRDEINKQVWNKESA